MPKTLSIVQLPFPSLSYFPVPTYFTALERWYQTHVSHTCTVPPSGIWEIPMWISWVGAAIQTAISELRVEVKVDIIDLNRINYSLAEICSLLENKACSDVYFFSPLVQNYPLTIAVAGFLKKRGAKVVIGGATATYLSDDIFDYIFKGRIESNYAEFLRIFAELFSVKSQPATFCWTSFASNLSYAWAKDYLGKLIYLRTFTYHGCPLQCSFCADSNSGIKPIPEEIIEKEITELNRQFPDNDVLYIGDLTFGMFKQSFNLLENVLANIRKETGKIYKLIIQTNPALVSKEFIDKCKKINVVLIELGIESGSATAVNRVNKKRPSEYWLEEKISLLINNGLAVAGNIIVGLPDDTMEDYQGTISFINRWKRDVWFNIYGLVPYQNTDLFRTLNNSGRIVNWDYEDWCEGKELVFEPRHLTRKEVSNVLNDIITCSIENELP